MFPWHLTENLTPRQINTFRNLCNRLRVDSFPPERYMARYGSIHRFHQRSPYQLQVEVFNRLNGYQLLEIEYVR